MKKVLVVTASYKPAWIYGGPIYSISALCEALTREGLEVHVMTTNANGKHDFNHSNGTIKEIEGVRVQYYRRITGDHTSVSPNLTLALLLRAREYDVVHIQGWWNWVAIFSLFVCKGLNVPHVLSPRGALSEYTLRAKGRIPVKKILHTVLFKRLLNQTTLHVTSQEERNKFRKILPGVKTCELPNLLTLEALSDNESSEGRALRLIFLGRINPVKNLEFLIECMRQIEFPYSLEIYGEGEEAYVEQLRTLASYSHQITFKASLNGKVKFETLANADLLVLLSHTENFGNVVIEALSQGTAVMLSHHVGAAEFVKTHSLGWVVEPTFESCLNVLNRINQDRASLKHIRTISPDIVSREFNTSFLAKRYINELYALATI